MVRLAVNGSSGRMGQTVLETANDRQDVTVVLGIAPGSNTSRAETATVPVVAPGERREALRSRDVDVVVDFSTAEAVGSLADDCAAVGVGLVSGTTDLDEAAQRALRAASETVPVVHASNFSRGIRALQDALDAALAQLPGYDVEVLETHHNSKQDAPSGTAETLLETIRDHREFETVHGRVGTQPREEGEVGVHVRRAGTVSGEHEVLLAGSDEVLTLTHRAEDRGVFASGALDAAVRLADADAGWYALGAIFEGHP
jgi:4-hydroxy-tetrahydrodipicolinate reductase